jgi:hypothetical protein
MQEEPSLLQIIQSLQQEVANMKRQPPPREEEYEDYGSKRRQKAESRCS